MFFFLGMQRRRAARDPPARGEEDVEDVDVEMAPVVVELAPVVQSARVQAMEEDEEDRKRSPSAAIDQRAPKMRVFEPPSSPSSLAALLASDSAPSPAPVYDNRPGHFDERSFGTVHSHEEEQQSRSRSRSRSPPSRIGPFFGSISDIDITAEPTTSASTNIPSNVLVDSMFREPFRSPTEEEVTFDSLTTADSNEFNKLD